MVQKLRPTSVSDLGRRECSRIFGVFGSAQNREQKPNCFQKLQITSQQYILRPENFQSAPHHSRRMRHRVSWRLIISRTMEKVSQHIVYVKEVMPSSAEVKGMIAGHPWIFGTFGFTSLGLASSRWCIGHEFCRHRDWKLCR